MEESNYEFLLNIESHKLLHTLRGVVERAYNKAQIKLPESIDSYKLTSLSKLFKQLPKKIAIKKLHQAGYEHSINLNRFSVKTLDKMMIKHQKDMKIKPKIVKSVKSKKKLIYDDESSEY